VNEHFDHDEMAGRTAMGIRNLVERITPWLFSVGSWVFGGLIAFELFIVSALLTVDAVDRAVLLAITAFACALPLNVAGICLLRLVGDLREIGIDDLTLKAFQEAGFPDIETYFPDTQKDVLHSRRSHAALGSSGPIAALSLALTTVGFAAALWHMAWWIALAFIVMAIGTVVGVGAVFAKALQLQSKAEQELKRRR
jgi:hypothetical protein